MKKILVSGGSGRFATELKKIKTNLNFLYLNKKQFNILNFNSIVKKIREHKPIYILHLAVKRISQSWFALLL